MLQRFTSSFAWLTFATVGSIALLSACTAPSIYEAAEYQQTQSWHGRMGLQIHDPQAQEQSFSASFQLQGSPHSGSLDIFNPLGSQIAQLRWQQGSAYLQQGERITASESLHDLLEQSLGTALPIHALFSWLQGHAASAPGWEADLNHYAQGRITAQRTTPLPQATLRVVLQRAN